MDLYVSLVGVNIATLGSLQSFKTIYFYFFGDGPIKKTQCQKQISKLEMGFANN
jgi:hypothetical protein